MSGDNENVLIRVCHVPIFPTTLLELAVHCTTVTSQFVSSCNFHTVAVFMEPCFAFSGILPQLNAMINFPRGGGGVAILAYLPN